MPIYTKSSSKTVAFPETKLHFWTWARFSVLVIKWNKLRWQISKVPIKVASVLRITPQTTSSPSNAEYSIEIEGVSHAI